MSVTRTQLKLVMLLFCVNASHSMMFSFRDLGNRMGIALISPLPDNGRTFHMTTLNPITTVYKKPSKLLLRKCARMRSLLLLAASIDCLRAELRLTGRPDAYTKLDFSTMPRKWALILLQRNRLNLRKYFAWSIVKLSKHGMTSKKLWQMYSLKELFALDVNGDQADV